MPTTTEEPKALVNPLTANHPQSIMRQHFLPAMLTAFVTSPARFMMNNSIEYSRLFGAFAKFPTHNYGFKGAPLNTLRGGSVAGVQSYVKERVLKRFDNPQSAEAQLTSLFTAVIASTPLTALFEAPYMRRTNEAFPGQVKYPQFSNYRQGSLMNGGRLPLFRYPAIAAGSLFIRDLKFAYNTHYGKDLPIYIFVPSMVTLATFSGFFHNVALRCIKEDLNLPEQGSQPHFKKDGGAIATLKKIGEGEYTHQTCKVPYPKDLNGKISSMSTLINILSVCCNPNMVFWRTMFFASFYSAHQLSKWAVSDNGLGNNVAGFFQRGVVSAAAPMIEAEKPKLNEDVNYRPVWT